MTTEKPRTAWATRASIPTLALALVGVAVSIYLTIEHFSGSTVLACPENATINCTKVTSSSWSRFAGIPVAVLGLAYFVGMAVLVTPAAWRRRSLDPIRVTGAGVGTGSGAGTGCPPNS